MPLSLNTLKLRGLVLLLAFCWAPLCLGQAPIASGSMANFNAHLGYSFTNVPIASEARLNMTGLDGGFTAEIKPKWGLELDLGYVRNFNAYSTGHAANLFTYLSGPVFYVSRGRRLEVYVHGLLGGALESGVNFDSNGDLLHGYVNKLAWAAGGGAEYQIDRSLSVRVGADLVHTTFFTPDIAITGQNDLRAVVGAAYHFGSGRP